MMIEPAKFRFHLEKLRLIANFVTCCKYTPICWVYYTYIELVNGGQQQTQLGGHHLVGKRRAPRAWLYQGRPEAIEKVTIQKLGLVELFIRRSMQVPIWGSVLFHLVRLGFSSRAQCITIAVTQFSGMISEHKTHFLRLIQADADFPLSNVVPQFVS